VVALGEAGAVAPQWIACMGRVRTVEDDIVVCPLGSLASSTHCLACHFLEGTENDRLSRRSCSVEPGAQAASCAELIIQVL
jgi:hypothetical protein